ncbi:unnamed protein product [Symbiodinium natans]|uniref:Uncharacterized protein n=1 Tax=Symbiodinium natans TaxID=878477 RepID=A0A812PSF0_9DINO|nr:unnamed protein product [Symbiodinium natans]
MLESAGQGFDVARDLALLAWSLAKLELASPRLMSAAADQILKQITARTCGPQAGARGLQLLQSGGSGGSRPSESSDRFALETLFESDQQELTNAAWALAEVRYRSSPFTEARRTWVLAPSSFCSGLHHSLLSDAFLPIFWSSFSSAILLESTDVRMSPEEAARGGYAMAWAQAFEGHAWRPPLQPRAFCVCITKTRRTRPGYPLSGKKGERAEITGVAAPCGTEWWSCGAGGNAGTDGAGNFGAAAEEPLQPLRLSKMAT